MVHARELRVRDDLFQMLRARLAELEEQPSKATQATVKKVSFAQKEPQDEGHEIVDVLLRTTLQACMQPTSHQCGLA